MKKSILVIAISLFAVTNSNAFCGFYVAKASAELFNNKSQIILARDGNLNTVTMSNDFKGDVSEFAMVVPVPVVLEREDIRVVDNGLFTRLDAYSAPRMVEYYDSNPCNDYDMTLDKIATTIPRQRSIAPQMFKEKAKKDYGVTIEAQYEVEEYDIMILSATRSSGLQEWLDHNGYKVPAKAETVLKPYIKNKMKFFVVKVNLDKVKGKQTEYLRPLQISYHHDKFMLPIRLGMANSTGEQDMVVYAFSKKGRIECANYRTVKIPTDRNIPKFIKDRNKFGDFYKDLYEKAYEREGKNAVFLEYSWDVSPQFGMKCDPCVAAAPQWADMEKSGVNWMKRNGSSSVFFTRLHVRYGRDQFPQDLLFMETPNRQQFQARYVIHHPASGDLSCDAGQNYLSDLENKRRLEIAELTALTGWNKKSYQYYIYQYSDEDVEENYDENIVPVVTPTPGTGGSGKLLFTLTSILALVLTGIWLRSRLLTKKLA